MPAGAFISIMVAHLRIGSHSLRAEVDASGLPQSSRVPPLPTTSSTSCARWPCLSGRSRPCARSWSRSAPGSCGTAGTSSSSWPRSRCQGSLCRDPASDWPAARMARAGNVTGGNGMVAEVAGELCAQASQSLQKTANWACGAPSSEGIERWRRSTRIYAQVSGAHGCDRLVIANHHEKPQHCPVVS